MTPRRPSTRGPSRAARAASNTGFADRTEWETSAREKIARADVSCPFRERRTVMSSEHSREVLREIAMKTADEGNVPGRPVLEGVLIAVMAVIAFILIYVATTTPPSDTARGQASISTPDATK
jgi:hypothetical protein